MLVPRLYLILCHFSSDIGDLDTSLLGEDYKKMRWDKLMSSLRFGIDSEEEHQIPQERDKNLHAIGKMPGTVVHQ